jgi:hypothetical protein
MLLFHVMLSTQIGLCAFLLYFLDSYIYYAYVVIGVPLKRGDIL